MIYFDYAATTPVDSDVLDFYNKITKEYPGNINSPHQLGIDANRVYLDSINTLASLINVKPGSLTITSGATESNNLAINGLIKAYPNRHRHILSIKLSHPSVITVLDHLTDFKVSYLNLDQDGRINLTDLEEALLEKPLLLTIPALDSELGIIQDLTAISNLLAKHQTFFHIDATQIFNKTKINFKLFDLISWSPHKYFGPKGIGYLYVRPNLTLKPIIKGGTNQLLRGGTIPLPLVAAGAKASLKALENIEQYSNLESLSNRITSMLATYPNVVLNHTKYSHPAFINFSIPGVKSATLVNAFSRHGIYLSARSACSGSDQYSASVLALTNDQTLASSSVRLTISLLTTEEEVNTFLAVFDQVYHQLRSD